MAEIVFVKYCPLCGAENPRQQAFCLSCLDGDLSTVSVEPRRKSPPPVTVPPAANAPAAASAVSAETEEPDTKKVTDACVLELVDDPSVRFTVRENETVGRTDKADVALRGVPKLDWISSAHAKFLRRNEQWYVQHVGQTNFIKVDGETYTGQEEVAIYHGSIIVLSLTAFRVNLEGN